MVIGGLTGASTTLFSSLKVAAKISTEWEVSGWPSHQKGGVASWGRDWSVEAHCTALQRRGGAVLRLQGLGTKNSLRASRERK